MSSPPCPAQIASLSQLYASLRSAVDEAAEALHAFETAEGPAEAEAEPFLEAGQRVSVLAREIAAILDR